MVRWFKTLKKNLSRSSEKIVTPLQKIFANKRLDPETLDQLEELLIEGDLGPKLAAELVQQMQSHSFPKEISEEDIRHFLAQKIQAILDKGVGTLTPDPTCAPWVCLIAGVNGSGKTTTIAKLASHWKNNGHTLRLVAGDTFRAAAVEQLALWGERLKIPVHQGKPGSDVSAVAFDALTHARQNKEEILILDTAGRLHTQKNLMDELGKTIRTLQKIDPQAPHSCLLVIDGTSGQNTLNQVEHFQKILPLTGLIITKMDSTAKGGTVVNLVDRFGLPVCALGVGEDAASLIPFEPEAFTRGLLGLDETP